MDGYNDNEYFYDNACELFVEGQGERQINIQPCKN